MKEIFTNNDLHIHSFNVWLPAKLYKTLSLHSFKPGNGFPGETKNRIPGILIISARKRKTVITGSYITVTLHVSGFGINHDNFYSVFQFAGEAAEQLIAEDKPFSAVDVALLQEIMGDIYNLENKGSEEEFLNVKLINDNEVSALTSLVENSGESLFYFSYYCLFIEIRFQLNKCMQFINCYEIIDAK